MLFKCNERVFLESPLVLTSNFPVKKRNIRVYKANPEWLDFISNADFTDHVNSDLYKPFINHLHKSIENAIGYIPSPILIHKPKK